MDNNTDNYYIISFDSREEQHINVVSGPLSKTKASFDMKTLAEKELDKIMDVRFNDEVSAEKTPEEAAAYKKELQSEYDNAKTDSKTLTRYLDGFDLSFNEDSGSACIRNYMDDWFILWEIKEIG